MLEVWAQRVSWSNRIDLMVAVRDDKGLSFAEPLKMKRQESDGDYSPATMTLENRAAQALMDELWRCGLRPTEGSGSVGSLAATERHLKDMQAVAMGLLRKEGVQL